jgi:putative thioredoxin
VTDSPWVVDVTMENFQSAVVDGSRERPVVIDFWAEWCGPCRRLAPLLEKAAVERNGGFLLAKVNTDEAPDLAQAFRVSGIPAVFAVRDGQVVDNFTGLLPEEEIAAFLDNLGATAAPAEPATPAELTPLQQATELEATDAGAAATAYRTLLADAPDDPAARVGLARALLAAPGGEAEAAPLLTGVEFGDFAPEAKRLAALIELRQHPHADSDLAAAQGAPGAEGKLALAKVLAARGDVTAALDALLAAAEDDQALGRGPVREFMLKVFEVIGPRSEQADDYRRRLQGLLY